MAHHALSFVRQIYEAQRRFSPWTPNRPVALGDVGVLVDGLFEPRTSLASLGIPFAPVELGTGGVLDFSSASGVTVKIQAKADAGAGGAKAGTHATISFTKSGGTVLQARGLTVKAVADLASLGELILERYRSGAWDKDWMFVSEVQIADATTVVVSEEKGTTLELDAVGEVAGVVPLAAGFTVSSRSGAISHWVGAAGLTPLFMLHHVSTSFWDALTGKKRGTLSAARRAALPASVSPPALEEVALEPKRESKKAEARAKKDAASTRRKGRR